ncbi:hypothetical protein QFC22_004874 [Naganishia vaughanmartiniae]|uniref:Uncharacterized protein n=1 Tax=Naganishia vaughanmartiniae TaxID=1424756 RepID=A0ACC2X0Z2_9TREE|nr:hypothetical protein QFC22_004874 [Naganishia vaughanmartiniae]
MLTNFAPRPVLASLLLLLTTVSTPIAKDLYFLQVTSNDSSTSDNSTSLVTAAILRLGTLGYCLSGNSSTPVNSAHMTGCTSAKIGYDLNYGLFSDGEIWGIGTGDLAAVSALISLTFAFFAWCCGSRIMEIIAMISTTLASLVAWIAWISTMALFAMAKQRIRKASNVDLEVKLGNCLWMSLVAAVSMILNPYSSSMADSVLIPLRRSLSR